MGRHGPAPARERRVCSPTRAWDMEGRLSLRRRFLVAAGLMSAGIGIVGVFVPLLPTTPLLLLAAACFLRSSERLHRWLTTHRWFGSYIRNYQEYRGITNRTRVVALLLLWTSLGYSAFGIVNNLVIRTGLLLVGLAVTLYVILRLKTVTREMLAGSRSREKP